MKEVLNLEELKQLFKEEEEKETLAEKKFKLQEQKQRFYEQQAKKREQEQKQQSKATSKTYTITFFASLICITLQLFFFLLVIFSI